MEELLDILKHPFDSGLLTFLGGALSVLGVYHLFLFFQQRVITYLYYSLYISLLCVAILRYTDDFPLFFRDFRYLVTEVSFVIYFLFVYSFLDVKKNAPKWNRRVLTANYLFLGIVVLSHVLFLLTGNREFISFSYSFFLFYMPVLAIIAYYPVIKSPNPLKYYIIFGSLVLFVTWLGPVLVFQLRLGIENFRIAASIFMMGAIFENFLFSLGLGHKQKLIIKENKTAHEKIIQQYKENEELRKTVQEKLEENLRLLNKKAEQDELDKIKARYEKELAELKILALRSQMNPHFIFNSLNSIKLYIINNEKENAVYYLNKFSKLIRKILDATRQNSISLAEELETMELYVSIENIRFNGELRFQVEKTPNLFLEDIKLPSLILQPFLENAIWHGLPLAAEKKLKIVVTKAEEDKIAIHIEDSGIGRQRSKEINFRKLHKKDSVGIKMTRERLNIFYKGYTTNYSLTFEDLVDPDGNPAGTRVSLLLPVSIKESF